MTVIPVLDSLIYIMVTMSVVDRKMSDRELSRIGDIIKTLPVFSAFDEKVGIVCVVSDDEKWVRGFGEQTGEDTVFLVGSIQKVFVAVSSGKTF